MVHFVVGFLDCATIHMRHPARHLRGEKTPEAFGRCSPTRPWTPCCPGSKAERLLRGTPRARAFSANPSIPPHVFTFLAGEAREFCLIPPEKYMDYGAMSWLLESAGLGMQLQTGSPLSLARSPGSQPRASLVFLKNRKGLRLQLCFWTTQVASPREPPPVPRGGYEIYWEFWWR